jgi:KaiC/GvpD/RAD55 family RecA-like ATPase
MTTTQQLHIILEERITELQEQAKHPEKYRPFSTGIKDLDRILQGGLPRRPFYFVLTGDKKAGKSTSELNITLNICTLSDEPIALYMLEELNFQVADRVLARHGFVTRSRIFNLDLDEHDFQDMRQTKEEFKEIRYYVNDQLYDIHAIYEDAKSLGINRLVIDNFQLLQGAPKHLDSREKLVYYSNYAMQKRKEGITTFMVSQENLKGGVYGSTQSDMDGDLVISLRRVLVDENNKKSGYMETMRRMIVRYSRYSPGDVSCDVFFDGNHSRILQVEPKRPDDPEFMNFLLMEEGPPADLED